MFKKVSFFFIVVLLSLPSSNLAQVRFEITPYYGYLLSTNVSVREGELVVKDSPLWGVTVDIGHSNIKGTMFELMYNRQVTRVDIKEYPSRTRKELFGVIIEYYQLGVTREIDLGNVKAFGVTGLGASNFNPRGSDRSNEWFFSGYLGLGAKVFFSDRVGLRFQTRALLPFSFSGGGIWCGTGGCGVGLGSYSIIGQFDFTAGLTIALGGK